MLFIVIKIILNLILVQNSIICILKNIFIIIGNSIVKLIKKYIVLLIIIV